MDLRETMLKIVENKDVMQINLTQYEENKDKYEEYITELKNILEEIQSASCRNTEILEVNNVTKNDFNENYKDIKALFGSIYVYVQQIEENLNCMYQSEPSLKELYDHNAEALKRIETNFNNALKTIDSMKNDCNNKTQTEHNEIKEAIHCKGMELKEANEAWGDLLNVFEDKQKPLHSTRLEIEILDNNIQLEVEQETLIQQKKHEHGKKLQDIKADMELKDNIIEVETRILIMTHKLKQVLEPKGDVVKKRAVSQKTLEQLEKEYSDLKSELNQTENERKKCLEKLKNESELKTNLANEQENKFSASKAKTNDINQAMEDVMIQFQALDDEFIVLERDGEKEFSQLNLEKILEEHDLLVDNSAKLLATINEHETEFKREQEEFAILKNRNSEIAELQEKIKAVEVETQTKIAKEKELEEHNKDLQQAVEQNQTTIKNLTKQKVRIEKEQEESKRLLKTLLTQYDNMIKEIRRLETEKSENVKLFPQPSLKPPPPSPFPTERTKKRGFMRNDESDSSVEGEKLTYVQYMAKKRMLKENKKRKRSVE